MLRNNIAGTLSQIGLNAVQPAHVVDYNNGNMAQDLAKAFSGWDTATKKQAYINALQGGNQDEINQAAAAIDPEAYAQAMREDNRLNQQREWALADQEANFNRQKQLAELAFGRQLALENIKNQNAIGLKQIENALKGQTDAQAEQDSLDVAQKGINQLAEVGKNNNLGVFTDWRRKHGLTDWFGNDVETDMGKISSAVAAVAPRAIAQLKKAGVSGINTKGEFMQYIGLPENPTSQQILGALPMMADIAGVKNPLDSGQVVSTSAPQASDPLGLR